MSRLDLTGHHHWYLEHSFVLITQHPTCSDSINVEFSKTLDPEYKRELEQTSIMIARYLRDYDYAPIFRHISYSVRFIEFEPIMSQC